MINATHLSQATERVLSTSSHLHAPSYPSLPHPPDTHLTVNLPPFRHPATDRGHSKPPYPLWSLPSYALPSMTLPSVRVPAFDQLLLNPLYSFEHIVSSHESLVALYYYHPQSILTDTDTLNAVYVPSSTLYFS